MFGARVSGRAQNAHQVAHKHSEPDRERRQDLQGTPSPDQLNRIITSAWYTTSSSIEALISATKALMQSTL